MLLCPSCHHQEYEGMLFCSECGAQLNMEDHLVFRAFKQNSSQLIPPGSNADLAETAIGKTSPFFSLHLVEEDRIFNIEGNTEITVGRSGSKQPILPDIDLAPYNAFELGVSRLHAMLKIVDDRLIITDLGSANGTWINGKKIAPQVDQILNHLDMVTFGKLKVQVLINQGSKNIQQD